MPLLFSRLCDLFSDLEAFHKGQPPRPAALLRKDSHDRVKQWCKSLSLSITSTELDLPVLLSALFPKRRTDRVYGIQPRSLSRKLKRILGLGNGRHQILDRWLEPGRGDLGDCVERALQQAEFHLQPRNKQVTLEEIDDVLALIAAGYRFSAPKVRAAATAAPGQDEDALLLSLYRRMQSREAKWLTKMILKDYSPVQIPEWLVFRCIHCQTALAMKIHDTFEDALGLLRSGKMHDNEAYLMPRIGIKVGRTNYKKARSVKHAVSIIQSRRMSVERKYDGEYCQIHVSSTGVDYQIQIFSKSGKDSTADRIGLHDTLRDCLRLGKETCVFRNQCILEGEMVIWSDREKKILEFHKIRKHVSRSGSFLGTSLDSLPHPYEHPMIVFYDILLLDDSSCLQLPHASRRSLLKRVVSQLPGRAEVVVRRVTDFSSSAAPEQLRNHYAHAIASRWEGLVLKPSDEPYFGPSKPSPGVPQGCWLKLKKDYIAGLGDTADFAVVGAGYDSKAASRCPVTNLNWTHFHLGCLKNKDAVTHLGAKPEYLVLDAIHHSLHVKDLEYLNQHGKYRSLEVGSAECARAVNLEVASWEGPQMTVAFRRPFIFEVMGGGFVKLPNSEHYTLRWPRVQKIHQDRAWQESISLDELRHLAIAASRVPDEEHFKQEMLLWRKRLDGADRGARKVMLPWDDSQDEQSDLDPSNTRPSRTAQRAEKKSVPSFVRMDTNEMAPDEHRLDSDEIAQRPSASGSILSKDSESSPTPPTSSPIREQDRRPTSLKAYSSHSMTNRKRLVEDPKDTVSLSKKPRYLKRNSPVKPLQESPSSGNRARRAATPLCATSALNAPLKAFLVRKVPPGIDGLPVKSRIRKPTRVIETGSLDRQTTVSDQTSQTTSHPSQPLIRAAFLDDKLITSSTNATPAKDQICSPALAVDEEFGSTKVPNLLASPVMLSPYISRTPYLLENLLPGRVSQIVPLPQDSNKMPLPTPPPTNRHYKESAVLLIESKRHKQSSLLMVSTLPCLSQCVYRRIDVWDWTLLELVAKGVTEVERISRRYFGSMWWDPDTRKANMHWQDGLLMRLHTEPHGEPRMIEKTWWKAPTIQHGVTASDTGVDPDAVGFSNQFVRGKRDFHESIPSAENQSKVDASWV